METRSMKTGEPKPTHPSPCLQIFIQLLLEENSNASADPLFDSLLPEVQPTTITAIETF
jgi:hypothetical protein